MATYQRGYREFPNGFDFIYLNDPRKFNDVLLYQIGKTTCDHIDSHLHRDFFELSLIISGKGVFYIDNKGIEVKSGDLFLAMPHEVHSIISKPDDPLHYYHIAFSFTYNSPFREVAYKDKFLEMDTTLRKVSDYRLETYFIQLIDILKSNREYSELEFEYALKQFAINSYYLFSANNASSLVSTPESKEQYLFFKTIHYIEKHLTEISKLTDISTALHYNYVYLARVFKNHYGESISEYVSTKKLDYAKQLIMKREMSVGEISDYLGYSCLPVFSKSFKRKFGISPMQYLSTTSTEEK